MFFKNNFHAILFSCYFYSLFVLFRLEKYFFYKYFFPKNLSKKIVHKPIVCLTKEIPKDLFVENCEKFLSNRILWKTSCALRRTRYTSNVSIYSEQCSVGAQYIYIHEAHYFILKNIIHQLRRSESNTFDSAASTLRIVDVILHHSHVSHVLKIDPLAYELNSVLCSFFLYILNTLN